MADSGMSKLKEQWHFLTKNIEAFDNLLYKNKRQRNQLKQRSNLLRTQIDQRIELINLIEQEVKQLDEIINTKEQEISELECQIELHTERYHSILVNSYRNRFSLKPMYYIFSSQGFWNAYKRWQYIQSFNSILQSRRKKITAARNTLISKKAVYNQELSEKEILLDENECQKQLMSVELKESKTVIKQLKKSRKTLNTKFKQHKSSQKILEKYYPAGKKQQAKKKSTNHKNLLATEAFLKKKKKLDWPVSKKRLAKRHGTLTHPKFQDVNYFHNGIDIRTNSTQVKSIEQGEVVDVFKTPGHKYTILLQHGDYFSLYSNLASVSVTLGNIVKSKQTIGTLTKKQGDQTKKLHFELWKDKESLNPESWLK